MARHRPLAARTEPVRSEAGGGASVAVTPAEGDLAEALTAPEAEADGDGLEELGDGDGRCDAEGGGAGEEATAVDGAVLEGGDEVAERGVG
jgi:hypothetical protein